MRPAPSSLPSRGAASKDSSKQAAQRRAPSAARLSRTHVRNKDQVSGVKPRLLKVIMKALDFTRKPLSSKRCRCKAGGASFSPPAAGTPVSVALPTAVPPASGTTEAENLPPFLVYPMRLTLAGLAKSSGRIHGASKSRFWRPPPLADKIQSQELPYGRKS